MNSISVIAGHSLTIPRTVKNIPTGESLTNAWFTVKEKVTDADPGVIQKAITTVLSAAGQITAVGPGPTDGAVTFELERADTAPLTPDKQYWYDFKVKTNAATPNYYGEVGLFIVTNTVITLAT